MKKLVKVRLINWHYLANETIELNGNTLLTGPNASGKSTIMDAITYMENCYSKDPSLQETAKIAGFSTAYFSRLFQSELGMSYTEYLTHVKIRHVQILLTQTNKSIMEIAQETGFCHGNYLSEQFKKAVGMTPGKYRRNARGNGRQEKKSILRV